MSILSSLSSVFSSSFLHPKLNSASLQLNSQTKKSKDDTHEISTFSCVKSIEPGKGWITSLTLLSNSTFASASTTGTITIYSPSGAVICGFSAHSSGIRAIKQWSNGHLVTSSCEGDIKIWNIIASPPSLVNQINAHSEAIYEIIELSNGSLATCSFDASIKIWDNTLELKQTLTGHLNAVNALLELSDHRLASVSNDDTIKFWEMNGNDDTAYIWKKTILLGYNINSSAMLELHNNKLAVATRQSILILDTSSYQVVSKISGHTRSVTSLQLLDRNFWISSSDDDSVQVWNWETFEFIFSKTGINGNGVYKLLKIKEGVIVSSSLEGRIKIWNY